MANPFLYPKSKHKRTQSPPQRKSYQQYKSDLQVEFSGQCVYCRMLDRIKGADEFGVDHYRPKALFPHLATHYPNLFYCCNRCNRLKRDYWPSFLHQSKGIFIPNPCDDVMVAHVRYHGGAVEAQSDAGEFTVERLDLNQPTAVEFRTGMIRALMAAEVRLESALDLVKLIRKLVGAAKTSEKRREAEAALEEAQGNVAMLEEDIRLLIG